MAIKRAHAEPKDLQDLFKEFYYRNLNREHVYLAEKAKEVLGLDATLEEAKKFMGKS